MGLIAQRLAGFETRDDSGWWTRDDSPEAGTRTPSGARVSKQSALGLTTVWRCIDLLSSAVSQAPKDVIVKVAGKSFPEFTKPSWLVAPRGAMDPAYSANDYFDEVAVSLLLDGNFFTLVQPSILDPQVLTLLDPGRVDVRPPDPKVPEEAGSLVVYDIKDAQGQKVATVGPMQMLHGVWRRLPGTLRGISPLETLRRGIGAAIAAEDFGARFFGSGAALSFGVEYPGQMDKAKLDDFADSMRRKYQGLGNSHAIGILTNGAKFVTGLAPTPEQAQMLATRQFSVEDLCRPFGVPPHMAGSQQPGASSYASADVNREIFVERSVIPLAVRIETPHNRLLSIPENLSNAPGASVQFRFNLDGISRGNVQQRFTGYQAGVMAGVLKPNEAREKEDLPPDPNGDQLFIQSGTVPIASLSAAAPKGTQTPQSEAPPL